MSTHNYYPPSIELPHFVDNESPVIPLILRFGVLWAAVIVGSYSLITRLRPTYKLSDRIAFVWMCLSMPFSLPIPPVILEQIANIRQPGSSICFSKPISLFTTHHLPAARVCSISYGKSTPSLTRGI